MDSVLIFVVAIVLFIVFIFLMRLLGAWMLRINTIIKNQQILINEIRKMNKENELPIS